MQVDVEDGLLRAWAAIKNGAVVGVTQPTHDLAGDNKQAADQFLVGRFNIIEGGDYLLWDDQEMYRRLRADIVDCDKLIVLVGNFGGNLPGDNFFEECLSHGGRIGPGVA